MGAEEPRSFSSVGVQVCIFVCLMLHYATRRFHILFVRICCSAADVYILRHFDAYRKHGGQLNILRLMATDRRINTIPVTVQRYCLIDRTRILAPTRDDILRHEIVITTLVTSLILTKLDIQGSFTHIFIDEAAQVLECEAIMPLGLASENTRIVLAGDHHQMCQKVYWYDLYSNSCLHVLSFIALSGRLFRHSFLWNHLILLVNVFKLAVNS